jgi:hypothetical protein
LEVITKTSPISGQKHYTRSTPHRQSFFQAANAPSKAQSSSSKIKSTSKFLPNPPGNYTITVQYQGNNSTTPLILDYFVVGDPWATPPLSSSPTAISEIPKTPVFSALAAIVGILDFSLFICFLFCGENEENHDQQIQRTINANNAIFIPQELDGDGKSYEAVVNDQPTE